MKVFLILYIPLIRSTTITVLRGLARRRAAIALRSEAWAVGEIVRDVLGGKWVHKVIFLRLTLLQIILIIQE